jgi:hypothetical protein
MYSKQQIANMLLRLMNDLHRNGRPVWSVSLFGVRVGVQRQEKTKFQELKARRFR